MLAVLRRRDFALLWMAGLVSLAGDWLLLIALPYHVYALTGSALATGATFMLYHVPRLLLSPVAGVLVDRWDRRRTLVLTNAGSAMVLLPLLLVQSPERVWIVYACVLLQACLSHVLYPARSALVPQVVPAAALPAANALDALTAGGARLLGPLLGGALAGLFGFGAAVVGDAASFLAAALLTLAVRGRPAAGPKPGARPAGGAWAAFWRDGREGLDAIRRSPVLAPVFVAGALVMLGYGAVTVLQVVFVREVLGAGAGDFGRVVAAQGAGFVAGGLLAARAGRRLPPARLLPLSLAAMGLGYVVAFGPGARGLPVVLAGVGLAGVGLAGATVSQRTLVQRAVPNRYLGRVFGAFATGDAAFLLAGLGLATALGAAYGPGPVLVGAGALYLVAGAVAWAGLARGAGGAPAELAGEDAA